jgi:hypothetical protein
MFSIFDYLRRLIRDSVLAGVQDAFEIMDQGDHRDAIAATALRLLDRTGPQPGPQEAPTPAPPAPRVPPAKAAPVPSPVPSGLIPDSFSLPSPELPALEGFQQHERRKKGPGRPQRPEAGRPQ